MTATNEQVKVTITGRASGECIVWMVSLFTLDGLEVYCDTVTSKETAQCAARSIASERGYEIVKER